MPASLSQSFACISTAKAGRDRPPESRKGFQVRLATRYLSLSGIRARAGRRARTGTIRGPVMTAKTSFRGSFTALVTPFKNGSVDEKAFRGLVDWQIAEGTNGLVPVGTTGESPTLSHDEHSDVVEWCVEQAQRPRAGGRRRRLQFDEGGDRARPARRKGRRRRRARGHALLQQADAGRALPALQGDQRRDRHSDHHLQHPAALGDRHVGRHHEAAVRAEEHCRREGRDRQRGARVAAARGHGRRTSTSSPARTRPRSASWRMAATAASR